MSVVRLPSNHDGWIPTLQADENANDSDKTLTVPANAEWQPTSIWVEYTSGTAVGNRQLVLQFQDSGSDVIGECRAGTVQAASSTAYYQFGIGMQDLTALRDSNYLSSPLPVLMLPASYKIRVYDSKAIAATADTMIVQAVINERAV